MAKRRLVSTNSTSLWRVSGTSVCRPYYVITILPTRAFPVAVVFRLLQIWGRVPAATRGWTQEQPCCVRFAVCQLGAAADKERCAPWCSNRHVVRNCGRQLLIRDASHLWQYQLAVADLSPRAEQCAHGMSGGARCDSGEPVDTDCDGTPPDVGIIHHVDCRLSLRRRWE